MKENNVGFTPQCHPELDSGSRCLNNQSGEILNQVWNDNCFGFTLMEVLIVVLVIGILSVVAVPQYQKAVLKSRFSSLMPSTKAVRDGNEAYYMEHGSYVSQLSELDVTLTNNEMTVTPNPGLEYAYVKATRSDIADKANLIMYQKHSENFPGEIHCEAEANNTQANWLCGTSLKGRAINGSITEGYNTYVLQGEGKDFPSNTASSAAVITDASQCVMNICKYLLKVVGLEDSSTDWRVLERPGEYTIACGRNSEVANFCYLFDVTKGEMSALELDDDGIVIHENVISYGIIGDLTGEQWEGATMSPGVSSLEGQSVNDIYSGAWWED